MATRILFLFYGCFISLCLPAQQPVLADNPQNPAPVKWTVDSSLLNQLRSRDLKVLAIADSPSKLYRYSLNPVQRIARASDDNPLKEGKPIRREGKEYLFYLLLGILLVFAILRQLFPKYFADLFRLFFRTTLKARQVREQMVQTPLPSLLLNIFFTLTAGLYITFLVRHYDRAGSENFWVLLGYAVAGLLLIYTVKYLGLRLSGWLFNMPEVADAYAFIVFIINKAAGIFLLPLLVLLAFTKGNVYQAALTFSFVGLGALLIYRFILSYAVVRTQIRVAPFHFFLYLLAFEVVPLLVIYKLLVIFIG